LPTLSCINSASVSKGRPHSSAAVRSISPLTTFRQQKAKSSKWFQRARLLNCAVMDSRVYRNYVDTSSEAMMVLVEGVLQC
jgi:hypothetical protein